MLGARGGGLFLIGALTLTPEEGLGHAHINHIPGQDLVLLHCAVGVEGGIDARAGEDIAPRIVGEALVPRVKGTTVLGGKKEGATEATVTASKDGLNPRDAGIVIIVSNAAVGDGALEEIGRASCRERV